MGNKPLIDVIHDYIRTTWSASCILVKTETVLKATNAHLFIYYRREQGHMTAYLRLAKNGRTIFDGHIRTLEDFKLIQELTTHQSVL